MPCSQDATRYPPSRQHQKCLSACPLARLVRDVCNAAEKTDKSQPPCTTTLTTTRHRRPQALRRVGLRARSTRWPHFSLQPCRRACYTAVLYCRAILSCEKLASEGGVTPPQCDSLATLPPAEQVHRSALEKG